MSAPNPTSDYYELLQVLPSASPEVIEAAYKGLTKKYGEDPDPDVRERRRFLDEAYSILGNAERRAEYDEFRNPAPVLAAAPPPPAEPARLGHASVVACAEHPEVQTALKCSRCNTPICPRCLVQTPVGARCKKCANMAKSPVYTVTGKSLWRAIAAAIIGGVVMGVAWGFASQIVVGLAYGISFVTLILGVGLGYAFTRIMEFATGRKRGRVVTGLAMGGILLATFIQIIMGGGVVFIGSVIAAGVGLFFAYQNLK